MLMKRALTPTLESGVDPADASELDPMQVDAMIAEPGHAAEQAEAAVHKLHTGAASLEELKNFIGIALQCGGLNVQGAYATGIALEHILDTLGLPQPDLGVSLEDFGDEGSDGPTKLVLEAINSALAEVKKALPKPAELAVVPA